MERTSCKSKILARSVHLPSAEGINSFVYAGWGTNLGSASVQYDTISILTLPAFHWISVPYNPSNPRHGHTCNAVGGSQILSIGGVDSNPQITTGNTTIITQSTFDSPDPFAQGLSIFDMTNLAWSNQYSASSPPYVQSDPVQQFYAQSERGYLQNLNAGVVALINVTHMTNNSTPHPFHNPQKTLPPNDYIID